MGALWAKFCCACDCMTTLAAFVAAAEVAPAPPLVTTLPCAADCVICSTCCGEILRFFWAILRLAVSGDGGDYRFFAAPGAWTVSVLSREGSVRRQVRALEPGLVEVAATLA